ncbi:aminomethyltransferase, partial [Acinetobacter baumannii]
MGTLTSALATAVTDEYIHLQQPIHELYLRADAQCMHIFDLDAGDRIQFDLPEQQSIDLLIFNTEQQLKPELLQALQAESHLVANG